VGVSRCSKPMPELPKKHSSSRRYKVPVKNPTYQRSDELACKIRSKSRWQRLREQAFRKMPYCVDPLGLHKGVKVPTEEIHHIIPIMVDPSKAHKMSNLAGLCKDCHRKVESRLRRGLTVKFSKDRFVV